MSEFHHCVQWLFSISDELLFHDEHCLGTRCGLCNISSKIHLTSRGKLPLPSIDREYIMLNDWLPSGMVGFQGFIHYQIKWKDNQWILSNVMDNNTIGSLANKHPLGVQRWSLHHNHGCCV
jgi:hypothetical protein